MTQMNLPGDVIHIRPSELLESTGPPPWNNTILDDGRNEVFLNCSDEGDGNKTPHIHPDFNETWFILVGELDYGIGDYPEFRARQGDIVVSPVGTVHIISSVGKAPTFRMALSKHGHNHDMQSVRGPGNTPFPPETSPPNLVHASLDKLIAAHGKAPWYQDVVLDVLNKVKLISTPPGDDAPRRMHPDTSSLWGVLRGELVWTVEGSEPVHARQGDIVFVRAGAAYSIETVGNQDAIRLSSMPGQGFRTVSADGTETSTKPDLKGVPRSLA